MIGHTGHLIRIATSGHSAWSQMTRTHALIFAFITFCFLVTIAFKESEQVAGIMGKFWIVFKSAREASLVHNAIMFLKLLQKMLCL